MAYLRTAPVVYVTRPAAYGSLPPDEARSSSVSWFTDGVWVWDSALVSAVESGSAWLPPEFLESIRPGTMLNPDPAVLEEAAALAKSSSPSSPSIVARYYQSTTAQGLAALVISGASSSNRAQFSDDWVKLRDSAAAASVPGMVKSLVASMVADLPTEPRIDAARTLLSSRRLLFPMGSEMVDEVLRWSHGLATESLLDEATRAFYGVVLCSGLYSHFSALGTTPDLGAKLGSS